MILFKKRMACPGSAKISDTQSSVPLNKTSIFMFVDSATFNGKVRNLIISFLVLFATRVLEKHVKCLC